MAQRIFEGLAVPVLRLGLPDKFIRHGDRTRLLEYNGLDTAGVLEAARIFSGRLDVLDAA